MATKRVSVSGLPHISSNELKKDQTSSVKTSFLVSTRYYDGGLNTSCLLDYRLLYNAISSQIVDDLGISPKGSNTQPIYINASKKFTASTANIGTDNQFPVTLRNGNFGTLPGIGAENLLIYVNSNGRLTSSSTSKGSNSAGAAQAANIYDGTPIWRGGNFKPIYMTAGKLEESTAYIGNQRWSNGWQTWCARPIFMDAGVLKEFDANIGHDTRPTYMLNGEIVPCGGNAGSIAQPVYMQGGVIKPIAANIGSSAKGIYMSNGQFFECAAAALPPVGFSKIELKLLVMIVNSADEGDDLEAVSDTDDTRLIHKGDVNSSSGSLVLFRITETAWYLIIAEGGSSSTFGVMLYIPRADGGNGWYNSSYMPLLNAYVTSLNMLYCNKAVKSSMCALLPLNSGITIGVSPRIKISDGGSTDANAVWIPQVKFLASNITASGGTISKKTKESGSQVTLTEVTEGTGTFAEPFAGKQDVKNLSVAWKQSLNTNNKYVYYKYGNNIRQAYIYLDKRKIRKFDFSPVSGDGAVNWGNGDTVLLFKCSF